MGYAAIMRRRAIVQPPLPAKDRPAAWTILAIAAPAVGAGVSDEDDLGDAVSCGTRRLVAEDVSLSCRRRHEPDELYRHNKGCET